MKKITIKKEIKDNGNANAIAHFKVVFNRTNTTFKITVPYSYSERNSKIFKGFLLSVEEDIETVIRKEYNQKGRDSSYSVKGIGHKIRAYRYEINHEFDVDTSVMIEGSLKDHLTYNQFVDIENYETPKEVNYLLAGSYVAYYLSTKYSVEILELLNKSEQLHCLSVYAIQLYDENRRRVQLKKEYSGKYSMTYFEWYFKGGQEGFKEYLESGLVVDDQTKGMERKVCLHTQKLIKDSDFNSRDILSQVQQYISLRRG